MILLKSTQFKSAISSIEDVVTNDPTNPLLTKITFVFADNRPNSNNQGIEEEEFDTISTSAINMPVKIDLVGEKVGGHPLSVPIGHITGMTKEEDGDTKRLVASAVLYREEFPKEVQFLKDAHASGGAPGISWEIAYKNSIVKEGVEWLKNAITAAATFVGNPAYGSRTALLAIASSAAMSDDKTAMEKLEEIVNLWRGNTPKGGNNMDELEKAQAALKEALEKITKLEADLATANSTITDKDTAIADKDAKIAGFEKAEKINSRVLSLTEAGLASSELTDERKEFLFELSDKAFETYLADMKAAKSNPVATASARSGGLPLPRLTTGQENMTTLALADLKAGLRNAARGIE